MAAFLQLVGLAKKNEVIINDVPTFKVQYMGNVSSNSVKGAGCADKALSQIMTHFSKSGGRGREMKLSIESGRLHLRGGSETKVEFRMNKIAFLEVVAQFPRIFVWIYKHQLKGLRIEYRCHAVMCERELSAKRLCDLLQAEIKSAWNDYMKQRKREESFRQRQRKLSKEQLILQSSVSSDNCSSSSSTSSNGASCIGGGTNSPRAREAISNCISSPKPNKKIGSSQIETDHSHLIGAGGSLCVIDETDEVESDADEGIYDNGDTDTNVVEDHPNVDDEISTSSSSQLDFDYPIEFELQNFEPELSPL